MRTREKLLHPATFLSLAALFVALRYQDRDEPAQESRRHGAQAG